MVTQFSSLTSTKENDFRLVCGPVTNIPLLLVLQYMSTRFFNLRTVQYYGILCRAVELNISSLCAFLLVGSLL